MVGNDLSKLLLNVVGVGRLTSNAGERIGSGIDSSPLDIPSWGFGQKEETGTEDEGPEELNGNRNSVGAGVEPVLS